VSVRRHRHGERLTRRRPVCFQPPGGGFVAAGWRMATDDEEESDRDRMITNMVIAAFLAVLVGGGLWLADAMFHLRKGQDCALSGRRNCADISVPARERY